MPSGSCFLFGVRFCDFFVQSLIVLSRLLCFTQSITRCHTTTRGQWHKWFPAIADYWSYWVARGVLVDYENHVSVPFHELSDSVWSVPEGLYYGRKENCIPNHFFSPPPSHWRNRATLLGMTEFLDGLAAIILGVGPIMFSPAGTIHIWLFLRGNSTGRLTRLSVANSWFGSS